MKINADGTVSITANDLRNFEQARNKDGDLIEVGQRLNKNQQAKDARKARREEREAMRAVIEIAERANAKATANA
jgi:hypothetical protein